jgi:hypothetical protein
MIHQTATGQVMAAIKEVAERLNIQ